MPAVSRARPGFELGLDLCVFLFLPLLTLFSRGAAPLAAVGGLCAFGLAAPEGLAPWRKLWRPAALFAALLLWGLLSAFWAVDSGRSLVMEARLLGLFAAGLALIAAAPLVAAPERLLAWFCAGLAAAVMLTVIQYATLGALTDRFLRHVFDEPALNQVENGFALLLLPLTVTLVSRRRVVTAVLLAVPTAGVIFLLVGDAARVGFVAGIVGALLIYLQRRWFTRAAAALAALTVLFAPLIFPPLIGIDAIRDRAEHLAKISLWHRLEIWSFVGARIAEHPLLGWGLDSSRAIPGGTAFIPFPSAAPPGLPGVTWLPLHPHNVTLQIWLELGLPGAALFALFIARLWLALGAAPWPRFYAAAVGGSLVSACVVALGSYGLWQEWWIGSEFLTLFLILVMARLAGEPVRKRSWISVSPSLERGAARSRR
jgi:hypothetical protein